MKAAVLPRESASNWHMTSISPFGPGPLLAEPEMAELRLLLLGLDAERESGQHVGELYAHHAQRERHADGSFQVRFRQCRRAGGPSRLFASGLARTGERRPGGRLDAGAAGAQVPE